MNASDYKKLSQAEREKRNNELWYRNTLMNRSGAAIIGDEKRNQLFIRVIDKTGEVVLLESLNSILNKKIRAKIESSDAWIVQVGGTEDFIIENLNKGD